MKKDTGVNHMDRYAIVKGRNMYYAGRLCGDETEEDAAQRLEIMNELDLLRTFKERIMQAALHQSALDWKKELLSDTVASAMPENVPVSKHRYELRDELSSLINKYYEENESNTPDFILAQYLLDCLDAFNVGVNARTEWYDDQKFDGAVNQKSTSDETERHRDNKRWGDGLTTL